MKFERHTNGNYSTTKCSSEEMNIVVMMVEMAFSPGEVFERLSLRKTPSFHSLSIEI